MYMKYSQVLLIIILIIIVFVTLILSKFNIYVLYFIFVQQVKMLNTARNSLQRNAANLSAVSARLSIFFLSKTVAFIELLLFFSL